MKLSLIIPLFLFFSLSLTAQVEKVERDIEVPDIEDTKKEKIDLESPKMEDAKEEIEEESEIEFIDQAPAPPPPPSEIFTVVEQMPQFPGCESVEDNKARKKCADKKMLQYVYGNLQYPLEAKKNKIEGAVVIRFFIDKDGTVKEPKIVKDIGDGCGEEALRVIQSMPNWTPGTQRGKPVSVYFNLPVRFRLEKTTGTKLKRPKLNQKF